MQVTESSSQLRCVTTPSSPRKRGSKAKHSQPSLSSYAATLLDELAQQLPLTHVAIAVSGGADSMALTLLASDWACARNIQLTALTVDHGLRAESAAEAQHVAQWMVAHGIVHHILTPDAPAIANLQTRARDMRYGALTTWARAHNAALLVAHHADDQAETVALQSHRGETPPSRSGMAFVSWRDSVALIRPLLGVRKQHLVDYLTTQSQPWIEDPSNQNDRFARTRIRRTMDDATMQHLWAEAQTNGAQRHADDTARNTWLAAHARAENGIAWNHAAWAALPDAMRTDLLSRAIQAVGGKPFRPRLHETQRLDVQLRNHPHGRATLGHCLLTWNAQALQIQPEHPLDSATSAPHMTPANPLKQLASEPFWWFNRPLYHA